MKKLIIYVFALFGLSSAIAGEPGILVLSDGEKIVLDPLRFKRKSFNQDWTRDCSVVDCKNTIKNKPVLPPLVWCPPAYCDPINPDLIATLIGEKTPHMRVKPDGSAALFLGDSQMTEPQVIKPPKLEATSRDIRHIPVLPILANSGAYPQVLYWLKVAR